MMPPHIYIYEISLSVAVMVYEKTQGGKKKLVHDGYIVRKGQKSHRKCSMLLLQGDSNLSGHYQCSESNKN